MGETHGSVWHLQQDGLTVMEDNCSNKDYIVIQVVAVLLKERSLLEVIKRT